MAISLDSVLNLKRENPDYAPALEALIILGLTRQERQVWEMCKLVETDARMVEIKLDMDRDRAIVILKQLYLKGIVDRRKIKDDTGNRYVYWSGRE